MLSASSEMAMRYIFFTYRKEQMFVKKEKRITLQKKIWCKIRYYQQLYDISDADLANYLGVTTRTLKNYDRDASNLTLEHLDKFLYAVNIDITQMFLRGEF